MGAKNVAEWARDEALRAKEEAVFARSEVECSKEKAKEEAYDLGVADTQATLKAQDPGVRIAVINGEGRLLESLRECSPFNTACER